MADSSPSNTPSVTISTSHRSLPRLHSSDGITSNPKSAPMSIPAARGDSPPPPLPPPRYIDELNMGQDLASQFSNRGSAGDKAEQFSVKPGSSLLGGHSKRSYSGTERMIDFGRPDNLGFSSSANAMLSPRALAGLADSRGELSSSESGRGDRRNIPDLHALLEYNKLQGEKQMGQRSLERSQHAYDKQLLSRIGGPRTPPRSAGGTSPSASNEDLPPNEETTTVKKLNGQLRPLSLPERRHSTFDVNRPGWNSSTTGSSSAVVSPGPSSIRSPMSEHGGERPKPRRFGSTSGFSVDENAPTSGRSQQEGFDNPMFPDREYPEDRSMQDLNINNDSPRLSEEYINGSRTGMKRRAASPPPEGVLDPNLRPSASGESWQQRHHQPQMAKFQHGSLSSSAGSFARNGPSSYGSSAFGQSNPSTAATSYTSEAAFHRQDSAQASMSGQQPHLHQQQQHPPPQMQNQHPPAPPPAHISQLANGPPPIPHRRTTSSGIPRAPGLWICDCCPKKPKKFESEDELRIHEMEKQYVCQYCNNRFKNKNEAERHQNSLHLRRNSWSCAALTSFEDAFHPTPQTNVGASIAQSPGYPPPPNSDTCGYCGAEFPNPPNWDDRVEHLNHIHKFGECNQSKKFFRADHFRQHLKHSHAGASGKWTNVLENACMRDEPPPQPINMQQMGAMQGMQPAMHQGNMNQTMMMQQGMGAPPMVSMMPPSQHPADMRTINEMREE